MKAWLALGVMVIAGVSAHAAALEGIPTYRELQKMFSVIDRSDNGVIDAFEWREASEQIFQLSDLNHDAMLDEAELAADARLRFAYPELNTLAEPGISRGEFIAMRRILFQMGDIDGDDTLSRVEFEILVLVRRAGWNAGNRNERITMRALRSFLERAFAQMDTNRDGMLSVEETPFLSPKHRAEMDPEGTGRISRDQLVNGYRWLLGADTSNKNRERAAGS